MSFYVYVLHSESHDRRYIGQTEDIVRRLEKHNKGLNPSTKSARPWVLLAWLACDSRSAAMVLEKKLKNLKSHKRQDDFLRLHGFIMQEVIGPEKSASQGDD